MSQGNHAKPIKTLFTLTSHHSHITSNDIKLKFDLFAASIRRQIYHHSYSALEYIDFRPVLPRTIHPPRIIGDPLLFAFMSHVDGYGDVPDRYIRSRLANTYRRTSHQVHRQSLYRVAWVDIRPVRMLPPQRGRGNYT